MLELRSKCHRALVSLVKAHTTGGIDSYYMCEECRAMCELELVNEDWDLDEEARALFAWSASPHTISECEDYLKDLINKLKGGINMSDIELGDKVRDCVSGIVGIAVSEIRYLSGCHQYGVQSKYESGKMPSAEYIDAGQLVIIQKQAASIAKEEDPGGAQSYSPKS